jgi:quercetin dioxygenase-like cupin family protein
MEIRRFGVGHRRPDGAPGTRGVESQSIHVDERGVIAEMALRPHGIVAPHTNPNLVYFVIVEGGGFVRVGDETSRVSAGDAVVWPPNVVHAAWTESTPMRAIVVELVAGSNEPLPLPEARAADPSFERAHAPNSTQGRLASKPSTEPERHKSTEKEPW